jgi:hypothetical protein
VLAREIELAERVVEQTGRRLGGETNIPDRLVSLGDLDARPIHRGRLQKPTEFGYKVALGDTPEGFVVVHDVHVGAPVDTETLESVIRKAKAIGMRIRTVLADRGFGNEVQTKFWRRQASSTRSSPESVVRTRWKRPEDGENAIGSEPERKVGSAH